MGCKGSRVRIPPPRPRDSRVSSQAATDPFVFLGREGRQFRDCVRTAAHSGDPGAQVRPPAPRVQASSHVTAIGAGVGDNIAQREQRGKPPAGGYVGRWSYSLSHLRSVSRMPCTAGPLTQLSSHNHRRGWRRRRRRRWRWQWQWQWQWQWRWRARRRRRDWRAPLPNLRSDTSPVPRRQLRHEAAHSSLSPDSPSGVLLLLLGPCP